MAGHAHAMLDAIGDEANNDKLMEIYNTWSQTYDTDITRDLGYCAPTKAAGLLSSKLKELGFPPDVRILDLGAGTGMVGEALHRLGHSNVDALDFSLDSLKVAGAKGVYKNLIRGLMASENCKDLGVEASRYDAAICVGVFTGGHVRGKGLDDFVHVLRPGGLACFSVREDVFDAPAYGYTEKMEALSLENKWSLVYKVQEQYRVNDNKRAWFFVYKVL